jgi:hypothetical protein
MSDNDYCESNTTGTTAAGNPVPCPNLATTWWEVPGIPGVELRLCDEHVAPAIENGHHTRPIDLNA